MTNYRGERPRQSTPLRNRCVKAWSVLCVLGSIGTHSVHGLKPSSSTKPTPPIAFSESLDAPEVSRRRLLFSSGAVAVAAAATAFLPSDAASAARAKGAAELDLEFYVRDLVGGNKKEGNIEQSKNGPPVPPPRRLEGPLVPMLLNKDCTSDCVSVQALIEELQQEQKKLGPCCLEQGRRREGHPAASRRDPGTDETEFLQQGSLGQRRHCGSVLLRFHYVRAVEDRRGTDRRQPKPRSLYAQRGSLAPGQARERKNDDDPAEGKFPEQRQGQRASREQRPFRNGPAQHFQKQQLLQKLSDTFVRQRGHRRRRALLRRPGRREPEHGRNGQLPREHLRTHDPRCEPPDQRRKLAVRSRFRRHDPRGGLGNARRDPVDVGRLFCGSRVPTEPEGLFPQRAAAADHAQQKIDNYI
mmetsp:Transcript_1122/g.2807  ORF Transcript_1122/g.2807 Transcript_1122/m.2807 type:complete len:413 (+) Transcript_1122:246-1484(+)